MRRPVLAVHLIALLSLGLVEGSARADREPFDLGVDRIEVAEVGGTTLFHDLRIACVVKNHGPGAAPPYVRLVLTRPTDRGRKVVKAMTTHWPLAAGKSIEIVGDDSVWHAATIPYRCAIDYGPPGALRVRGDYDASNDLGQSTYPTP
jgi:hypothetical protein